MKYRAPYRFSPRPLGPAGLLLSTVLLAALCYFKMPALRYDFSGIYVVLLVAAIAAVALLRNVPLIAAYTLGKETTAGKFHNPDIPDL